MNKKISLYDIFGLSILIIQGILLVLNYDNIVSNQKDWPYHLMIARMFVDRSSILWDFYEYAPIGRPNLYPPFLHSLFAVSNIMGMGWVTIQKFYGILMYLVSLFVVWFVSRDLFGKKVGALSILVLSLSTEYWYWQISIAPTSIIFGVFPLVIWAVYREKTKISIALLTICLWSHFSSFLIVIALLTFAAIKREYLKKTLKIICISLLLYSPWAIHVLMNIEWFNSYSAMGGVNRMELIPLLFGIPGILFMLRRRDTKDILILSTIPSILLIGVLYGSRLSVHAPVMFALISAIGIFEIFRRINSKIVGVAIITLIAISFIGNPTFSIKDGHQIGKTPLNIQVMPVAGAQHLDENVSSYYQNSTRNNNGLLPPPREMNDQMIPEDAAQYFTRNVTSYAQNKPDQSTRGLPQRNLLSIDETPLLNEINSLLGSNNSKLQQSGYLSEDAFALYEYISSNTSSDEIIHVDSTFLSCVISLFTDRRTDNGMWKEVSSGNQQKSLENIKIGISEISGNGGNGPGGMNRISEESIIAQFGQFVVYDVTKTNISNSEIPRIPMQGKSEGNISTINI